MAKKKKMIIIAIIVSVVIILTMGIVFTLLYINTDMFKSSENLFFKYIGKNTENLKATENILNETEINNLLENNKHEESVDVNINYIKNLGTTSENTSNSVNQSKIKIQGKTDKSNKYDYKDIRLLNNDEETFKLEYIRDDNIYGIRFSDLYKQYLTTENTNIKDLLRNIGYEEEQLQNIPDSIILDEDILSRIKFSDDEVGKLENKYLELIKQNTSKEMFEKQANQTITVNEKSVATNAYVLNLTKEQLNNIYIKILENIKEDEIILSKIENIQDIVNQKNIISIGNSIDLKEKVINTIDSTIQQINQNNIGNEQTKIIVYENQGQTVRTSIQGVDYEVNLDFLQNAEEGFLQFNYSKNEKQIRKFTLVSKGEKVILKIEDNTKDNPVKIDIEQNIKTQKDAYTKNVVMVYENEANRIQANILDKTNIVNEFENQIMLDDKNSIQLDKMEKEQLQKLMTVVKEGVNNKINSVSEKIKKEDIEEILKAIGIIKEEEKLNTTRNI